MKVACVGGGPAGLYLSILLKRQDPSHDITVHERDPEGSTYGWGVTYWRGLLDKLHLHDPESARAIEEASVTWNQGEARVRDLVTRRPSDEGFGIGRHRLLEILAARARSLGVRLEFEHEITHDNLPGADLVVACDGVRSALRTGHADHFGAATQEGRNHYIWLGTSKVFDSFTFAFVETDHGWIWCYGYAFSPERSTVVVECAPRTWSGLGLDSAGDADGLALLEKLFADVLDGHPLIGRSTGSGSAQWLNFRTLTNRTWHRDNLVLLGDAAHTTHYSIGAAPPSPWRTPSPSPTPCMRTASFTSFRGHSPATSGSARRSCSPSRARPATAPSGTRTCPATSTCRRSRCSRCSVSVTPRCCPMSRPSCTTGSTRPPGSWRRCAGSSAGSDRRSRAVCTHASWPRGSSGGPETVG